MGSYWKIPSIIPGFYSPALDKCAICNLEPQEPVVRTSCGHGFCREYMMRYDFNELMYSIRIIFFLFFFLNLYIRFKVSTKYLATFEYSFFNPIRVNRVKLLN